MTGTCQGCGTPIPPSRGSRPRKWCTERCRKVTLYAGACVDCGSPTNGYNGPGLASKRCVSCRHAFEKTDLDSRRHHSRNNVQLKWTDEQIIAAVRRAPTKTAYDALYAASPKGAIPSLPTITKRFGLWSEAVRAAGFTPCHSGAYSSRMPDEGMLLAVEDCMADLGITRPPSVREYERWARRTSAPAQVSLRNRFGSWMAVVDAVAMRYGKRVAA